MTLLRVLPPRPLVALALTGALALPLSAAAAGTAAAGTGVTGALRGRPASLAATPGLGYDRLGLRRDDSWVLASSLDGASPTTYAEGPRDWLPVAGDTDGDGDAGVSLFKNGLWLIRDQRGGLPTIVRFGQPGDLPVLGDWDGDGKDTLGVFRQGRWFLRNDLLGGVAPSFTFGAAGDVPVVGDWNGDGRTDIGLLRGRTWYERDSASGGLSSRHFDFGLVGDRPVAGDWNHDGIDSPGVFRNGTWYLLRENARNGYDSVRFGTRGDLPVVRRTAELAPGVTHEAIGDPSAPWTAQVVRVDLAAASSPEPVLSGNRLAGIEPVSSISRGVGAVAGVNGDYFYGSGRPVHLFASDGELIQTPTTLGRAFSLDAAGTRFAMGYPDVSATLTATTTSGPAALRLDRVNNGRSDGPDGSAWTAHGAMLDVPGDGDCYAGLAPAAARTVAADGTVRSSMTVTGTRCGGSRPIVPPTGMMISADPFYAGSGFVRALTRGQTVELTAKLGFPGAVDAMGGNPLLVSGGTVLADQVDQPGAFYGRNPRTAVGVTADGRLLMVVVDGRSSRSRGMSMRELAELMRSLGATEALNLDGGGSSAMFLNGLTISRPSDGYERGVSNALVVLPGADAGKAGLRTSSQARRDSLRAPGDTDPASTGGLADALLRQGVPMSAELRRTAMLFRSSR